MEYVLQTQLLTKAYGRMKAVDKVSMNVRKGDIYGFIGRNGAGKTTFMRLVAGLAAPDSGHLQLFGESGLDQAGIRRRIGTLIENPGLYQGMTARDNLEVLRLQYGIPDRELPDRMLAQVGLEDTGKKKVRKFSMGMKQRLGIAIALLHGPDFLILDEPINGLDPAGIREVRELLVKLNREKGITILVSSHILGELEKVATCYGIIRDGKLVEELDAGELARKNRRCHKLVTQDVEVAVRILEDQLHIQDYDVPRPGVLRVFEYLEDTARVNRVLAAGGVAIQESFLTGVDLEAYFMERMGGQE